MRKPYRENHRPWKLPRDSELPKEFIRLCPWGGEYLFNLAKLSKLGILEIGRFRGGSCFLLSCANPEVDIHSIDIDPMDDARLLEFFEKCGVGTNVELIVGESQQSRYSQIQCYDVLWIDGDHSYQGCMNDLNNWYEGLEVGGHLILHDCFEGVKVKASILDFLESHPELKYVTPPYKNSDYWCYPEGSLFHAIKTPR